MHELDDILSQWHDWQQHYSPCRGFNGRALVCGEFRISRQYDDVNGALDDALHKERMATVSHQISELPEPYRYSLSDNARELSIGAAIRHNPRLPADRHERNAIRIAARDAIARRLQRAGIMTLCAEQLAV